MGAERQTVTSREPGLSLDSQLCFPLYAASNLVTRAYVSLLRPLNLTYPQYLVMLVLWEHQRMTVGDLGERLHLDSGTLTPVLKRMATSGHIVRRRDPDDERRVIISLSDQGRALEEKARGIPQAMACRLTSDNVSLSRLRDDLKSLISVLDGNRAQNLSKTTQPRRDL